MMFYENLQILTGKKILKNQKSYDPLKGTPL